MVRSGLGILVGAIVWMAAFYALTILMAASWPDYGIHGSEYINEGRFTFTPLMACFNLLCWVLAEIGAGWVAMKIAKRREAVWVLAGLQTASGVPLQCGEGPEFKSFRIGLFGLEKWHHVDRTVGHLAAALDRVAPRVS